MVMDIILVQMDIARGKPSLNRAKVLALTGALHPAPGKPALLVLPELFSTGYLDPTAMDASQAAFWSALPGEDAAFLASLARKLGCWVAGSTVEKGPASPEGNGGFRNLSLIFSPDGSEKSRYRKIHPFSYGGEDRLFARGNEIVTCDIDSGKVSEASGGPESWVVQPTICYDLRFPELYRAGSLRGTHLIIVQANWPQARQLHWETLLRARAIENQAFVAGVNCTGSQESLVFSGGSILISPKGETVAQGAGEEGLVRGQAALDLCKQWRRQFPALRDRMSADFYDP
jgi:omega-amidase